jgi:hypothetical protein
MKTLDLNVYSTDKEEVILFSAVSKNVMGNISREGVYSKEEFIPRILKFAEEYKIEKVYLYSLLPEERSSLFKKVEGSFLSSLSDFAKRKGIETEIYSN